MANKDVILLLDRRGQLIHSRSTPECRKCLDECAIENELVHKCGHPGRHRRGVLRANLGSVHLCTDNLDEISSSKLFKKKLYFYAEMLGSFQDIKRRCRQTERNSPVG